MTIQMKAATEYFHAYCLLCCIRVVLTFKSVDGTLVCEHSNKSYCAFLSRGTAYNAVQSGFTVLSMSGKP